MVTLDSLLEMEAATVTPPLLLALPDAPQAPQSIQRATHDTGLLEMGASLPGIK